jgi:hypothetical protein
VEAIAVVLGSIIKLLVLALFEKVFVPVPLNTSVRNVLVAIIVPPSVCAEELANVVVPVPAAKIPVFV